MTAEAARPSRTLRKTLGPSAVGAPWELLYDKPRSGVQIVRDTDRALYAIVCVKHLSLERLAKLSDEAAVRKAGGWCSGCQH